MFGEGDRDEMKNLGDLTGGKSFDAKNSSLTEIFKEIRGYQ
jgi:Ca-activated chloride channel family protein